MEMPANLFRPGRQSATIDSIQVLPSSPWNSDASKPRPCSFTGSDQGPVGEGEVTR
jgi:hypothetical protein